MKITHILGISAFEKFNNICKSLLTVMSKAIKSFIVHFQGGSMPNTSSSVPFLLTSSMQSIRSRRTSTCLSSGPLGSGSGLLQQLGSGMVRQLGYGGSGTRLEVVPKHQQPNYNGSYTPERRSSNYNVRKCPSLNITFSS